MSDTGSAYSPASEGRPSAGIEVPARAFIFAIIDPGHRPCSSRAEVWMSEGGLSVRVPPSASGESAVADRLASAIRSLPPHGITLREIRDLIGSDGLMVLTAFLTVVFLVPVSIPGVSTVFGAGILLIGLSRLFRRDLWLPHRIGHRVVPTITLRSALERGVKTFRRLERFSRPQRVPWATSPGIARVLNDVAIVVGALLLMAPFGFVPFSNTLPAVALLLLAIGCLQRDGVCVVMGHVAIVATIGYFVLLIGGGAAVLAAAAERLLQ